MFRQAKNNKNNVRKIVIPISTNLGDVLPVILPNVQYAQYFKINIQITLDIVGVIFEFNHSKNRV